MHLQCVGTKLKSGVSGLWVSLVWCIRTMGDRGPIRTIAVHGKVYHAINVSYARSNRGVSDPQTPGSLDPQILRPSDPQTLRSSDPQILSGSTPLWIYRPSGVQALVFLCLCRSYSYVAGLQPSPRGSHHAPRIVSRHESMRGIQDPDPSRSRPLQISRPPNRITS